MKTAARWQALDALRGLSIALMMFNIIPGSWDHSYRPLLHVEWAGLHLIDLVSPTFLFCVGASIPFSLGHSSEHPYWDIWRRSLILIALGLFLNLFPEFDWQHLRLPGTLQRIGLCYVVVASVLRLCGAARPDEDNRKILKRAALLAVLALVVYAGLLALVPVPGYGAPRYDPLGSWPAVVDRMVFGANHLYAYWPVNGRVLFDPDGLVASLPVCFNLLVGAIFSLVYQRFNFRYASATGLGSGLALIILGIALNPIIPIIKNIWTPSFALVSCGTSLCVLAVLDQAFKYAITPRLAEPLLTFGGNALLAYSATFLLRPIVDHHFIREADKVLSIREWLFETFCTFVSANMSSLLFSLLWLMGLYILLRICAYKKWYLRV